MILDETNPVIDIDNKKILEETLASKGTIIFTDEKYPKKILRLQQNGTLELVTFDTDGSVNILEVIGHEFTLTDFEV